MILINFHFYLNSLQKKEEPSLYDIFLASKLKAVNKIILAGKLLEDIESIKAISKGHKIDKCGATILNCFTED